MADLLDIWYFSCLSMGSLWSEMCSCLAHTFGFLLSGSKRCATSVSHAHCGREGSPWGQPTGVPWVTARSVPLAGQCHTTGLTKRAGQGQWWGVRSASARGSQSLLESGDTWLWCSSGKDFQAQWGEFDLQQFPLPVLTKAWELI